MARNSVKLVNAALDEVQIKNNGKLVVLRGVLENDSLDLLQVAAYQREVLPQSKIMDLVQAMNQGRVPDVELGMRGGNFRAADDSFYLQDQVFIIDGLQRISDARHMLRLIKEGDLEMNPPHLGTTIFFNTTEEWERERFRVLNSLRTKLSPNVLLRNRRHEFSVVEAIYNLATADASFVMRNRICWSQKMNRGEFISAQTYLRTVGNLCANMGPTRTNKTDSLLPTLQTIMGGIGRNTFRDNIREFFNVVDQAYGIRLVTYKENAAYLRHGFLFALATVFSNHENFWRGNRLHVDPRLIYKLRLFALSDPNVRDLCSSGGQGISILYRILVDHLNSGRRTGRLAERVPLREADPAEEEQSPADELAIA